MSTVTTLSAQPQQLTYPTGAVEVLPPDAPRPAWLAERRRSIGGSDASTLVGLNPYGSMVQLWLDKTGQLPELRPNSAMEWGNLLEPVVRDVWLPRTYDLRIVRAGLLRHPDHPRVHANPDGIVLDDDGVPVAGLEVKTTNWRQAHEWADGQIPDHAELQAQLCMFITGLPMWWVVGLIDGRDPQVRKVHVDAALGALLAGAAARFWADYVDAEQAPALDDSTATEDAVRAALAHPADGKVVELTDELRDLFAAHEAAKAAVRDAEAAERLAGSTLRMHLGDAAMVVADLDGPTDDSPKGKANVYATAVNNGTFAAKRFIDDEPETAAEFTVDQPALDVPALKAGRQDLYRKHCARVIRLRKPLKQLLVAASPTTEES